jgi:hypothetical protein
MLIFIDFTSLRETPGASRQEVVNAKKKSEHLSFLGRRKGCG